MTLSAWDVYWVMQLDSIVGLLAVGAAGCFAGAVVVGLCTFDGLGEPEHSGIRLFKRMLGGVALFGSLAALTPSTKTAAAMIVVPALANNETLHREAGELYGLAKSALREAVSGDEAKE